MAIERMVCQGGWSSGVLKQCSAEVIRRRGEKKMRKRCLIVVALGVLVSWGFLSASQAEDVKRITKEELKSVLSDPSVVVVDVRKEGDWEASELKIKGAVREDPAQVASWMNKYGKDKTLVFYCA
jgi:predicted sulfurtransferase